MNISLRLWLRLLFTLLFFGNLVSTRRKIKVRSLRSSQDDGDPELRRTKRNIYHSLLMSRKAHKHKGKRQLDVNGDRINPRDAIARPIVRGQVQTITFQLKVVHDWRDEMVNNSSPAHELLAGNIVDAFGNELTADYHYHSSAVLKLRKADRNHMILADVAIQFYKSEGNPLPHIQGIINKGWISGQRVDPNFFKVLGILNGQLSGIEKLKIPMNLRLRLVPPSVVTPTQSTTNKTNENVLLKQVKYKEIKISIKLKQLYGMFLSDRKSPEYKELSGNLEQAIYKIFSRDSFFLATKTVGFRESPEGRCIAVVSMDFKYEEKYAIEKSQAMISGGDLAGMPVDDTYLIVNSLSEIHKGGDEKPSNLMVAHPNPKVVEAVKNLTVSTVAPFTPEEFEKAKSIDATPQVSTPLPPEGRSGPSNASVAPVVPLAPLPSPVLQESPSSQQLLLSANTNESQTALVQNGTVPSDVSPQLAPPLLNVSVPEGSPEGPQVPANVTVEPAAPTINEAPLSPSNETTPSADTVPLKQPEPSTLNTPENTSVAETAEILPFLPEIVAESEGIVQPAVNASIQLPSPETESKPIVPVQTEEPSITSTNASLNVPNAVKVKIISALQNQTVAMINASRNQLVQELKNLAGSQPVLPEVVESPALTTASNESSATSLQNITQPLPASNLEPATQVQSIVNETAPINSSATQPEVGSSTPSTVNLVPVVANITENAALAPKVNSMGKPSTAPITPSNNVPTVANIISSLVNGSSSVPVITEAPVPAPAPVINPGPTTNISIPLNTSAESSAISQQPPSESRTLVDTPEVPVNANETTTPVEASLAVPAATPPILAASQLTNNTQAVVTPDVYPQALANGGTQSSPLIEKELPVVNQSVPIVPLATEAQAVSNATTSLEMSMPVAPSTTPTIDETMQKPQPILINQMSAPLQYNVLTVAIRLFYPWDDALINDTELTGDLEKAIDNELSKSTFYVDVAVNEFLKDPENQTIAHISVRFLPEESSPLDILKAMLQNGTLGGLAVDKDFFFVLSSEKTTAATEVTQNTTQEEEDKPVKAKPVMFKEIRVSLKLLQPWNASYSSNNSLDYAVTSGMIEQSLDYGLMENPNYIDSTVLELSQGEDSTTIAYIAVRFRLQEEDTEGDLKTLIKNGTLSGVPVDANFFEVFSISETDHPESSSLPSKPPDEAVPAIPSASTNNSPLLPGQKQPATEVTLPPPGNVTTQAVVETGVPILTISLPAVNATTAQTEAPIVAIVSVNAPSLPPVNATMEASLPTVDTTTAPSLPVVNVTTAPSLPVANAATAVSLPVVNVTAAPSLPIVNVTTAPSLPVVNATMAGSLPIVNATTAPSLPVVNETTVPISSVNATETKTEIPASEGSTYPSVSPTGSPPSVSTFSLDTGPTLAMTSPPNSIPQIASDRVVTIPPFSGVTQMSSPSPTSVEAIDLIQPVVTTSASNVVMTDEPTTIFGTTPSTLAGPITPEQPGGSPLNEIEGSMILQQNWHPYLSDKSSSEYRVMEQTIGSAIKSIYAQTSDEVIPQILSFSEVDAPDTPIHNASNTKVDVHFKVMFLPGHKSDATPLRGAIEGKSVAGILVYPTSFALKTTDTIIHTHDFTSCQALHNIAMSAADGQIGGFIPECTPDGKFKPVQCHALTGFCWCVNHVGVRIIGTEERYKEPSCEGMLLTGTVILPDEAPAPLLPGSCLTVSIQESVSCGGNVNCHLPLLGNKTFHDIVMVDHAIEYSLPLMQLKPGVYAVTAVLNVGWCRINSVLSKDLIHQGDYHSTTLHDVTVEPNTKVIMKDIELELLLPEETGINLSGDIILPNDAPSILPPGSCLIIQTKSWDPASPVVGNMTVIEPDVLNNTISYSLRLPDIDPGAYMVRCVIHLNQCNIIDNTPNVGDYFTEKKYQVFPDTTEVEEDLVLVQQSADNQATPPAPAITTPITASVPVTTAELSPPTQVLSTEGLGVAETSPPSTAQLTAQTVSTPAAPIILPETVPATPAEAAAPIEPPKSLTATSSDGKFDYQFTLLTNPDYVGPKNKSTEDDQYVYRTGLLSVNSSTEPITNESDAHFITLPNGLPKSCQGIRDAGIGNIDGQYIIEARPSCHISVICVNMDDENTKEFLGGPSEEEWKYWHYAVLIKISEADKKNLPQGACLEASPQGRELLHRILVAGAKEGNPISQWKTKISNYIRRKRNLPEHVTIMTKPRLIRKERKHRMWTSK